MHYIIDGYNLMFRVLRAGNDLKTQRETIIRDLNRKIQTLNLNVMIVFDAQYQPGDSSQSNLQHFEILFTKHGETADELILQKLKHVKRAQEYTVVTSDKKLAWLARLRQAKTESVEEFLQWLNARFKNKLRKIKEPLPEPILKKPEKKVVIPLTPKSSVEECQDFYLEQFENKFKALMEENPIKTDAVKKTRKPKEKKKSFKKDQDHYQGLSDMERWEKAFGRDLTKDL